MVVAIEMEFDPKAVDSEEVKGADDKKAEAYSPASPETMANHLDEARDENEETQEPFTDDLTDNDNSLIVDDIRDLAGETKVNDKQEEDNIPFDKVVSEKIKIWQETILQMIQNRVKKLPICATPGDINDDNNLLSVLSNLDGEGVELDEEGYTKQVKNFADFVANSAVIPNDDDYTQDEIDVEERKLEYSVRREIAAAVISEKMLQGYTEEGIPCLKCGMPLMKFHGVMNCVVCPVLVKEIDKAIKIRREIFLRQKVEEIEKAIVESEAKNKAATIELEKIKEKKISMEKNATLLLAAAKVAEEQAQLAASKSIDVQKELAEAKKVSAEAWNIVATKTDEMKVAIKQSKYTIEQAMKTIEEARSSRQEIKVANVEMIENAEFEQSSAETELKHAKEEQQTASVEAAAAAEALRLALLAKEAADKKLKESEDLVSEKESVVETKILKVNEAIKHAEVTNKEANEKVQLTVIDSARIEKETTSIVEKAHKEKCKAEIHAKKCDDQKMHKEAKALVAERLSQLATESRDKALTDAEKISNELALSDAEIKETEDKIHQYEEEVEIKKKLAKENAEAVAMVQIELKKGGIVFEDTCIPVDEERVKLL